MLFGIIAAGTVFICTPIAVWDGDGPIWCEEGPRIRLHAIAARELDGSCRPRHPCPRRSGVSARDHLVSLLGGAAAPPWNTGHIPVRSAPLACRSFGSAGRNRTEARCSTTGNVDLGCQMVRDGFALEWNRFGSACGSGR